MATYLNKSYFSESNGSHFYIELQYDVLSQDVSSNSSTVRYYLYLGSTDGYSGSGTSSVNCYINGNLVGSTTSIGVDSRTLIGTRDEVHSHDSDGNCSPSYSASATSNWDYLGNSSMSGSYSLPAMPKYANFTEHYIYEVTENSISVYWSADSECDYLQYSLNGGEWIDTAGNPYTITGLESGTTYSIRTKVKKIYTDLWTESSAITGTTLDTRKIRLKVNGEWKKAIPYLKINGEWKKTTPYLKVSDVWKEGN